MSYLNILIEVILEFLEDGVARLFVALEIVAVFKLLDSLFLFAAESFWNIHTDINNKIALSATIALNSGQAFTSQTECLSWLCSIFQLYL